MDVLLVYPLSADGQLGCFYVGAVMSNAAMNIHIQMFVWSCFQYISRRETAGLPMITPCLAI